MNLTAVIGIVAMAAGGIWWTVNTVRQAGIGVAKPSKSITRATAFAYLDSLRGHFQSSGNKAGESAILAAGKALFDAEQAAK
jgi:hypothetical protein